MATPRAALMLVSSRDWMSQPASVRSRSMVWRARSSGVMGMDGKGDYSASGEYEGGLMLRGLRRQAPATVRPLRLGRRKKQVPHTVRKRRERVRDDNRTTNGNGMGPKSRSLTPFANGANGFGMTSARCVGPVRPPYAQPQMTGGADALTGPEPAEGGGGQQGVDESVDDFFQGRAPRLALPDAVAEMSEAMGEERRSACYAGDGEIVGAGRDGATGEIGDEDTDDQAIGKPHPEELGHGDWTTGKHGQHAHRSLLEFFYGGRRLHLFVGGKRKHVETALQTSGAQGGKNFVLVGERLVVPALVRQQHVHDGAGDKDDDGGQNNGEPKSREGNHTQPPRGEDECRSCLRKRLSFQRSGSQVTRAERAGPVVD